MNVLKNLDFKLFGESHGDAIGFVLSGFPAGVKIDYKLIEDELTKRRPSGKISTPRVELDDYKFISGVFNEYTTGENIMVLITNTNKKSSDYNHNLPRPSHSDLVAYEKTNGFNDYRGGGAFSGRLTAPLVIMGALAKSLLKTKDIKVISQIKQIGNQIDDEMSYTDEVTSKLQKEKFPCINDDVKAKMRELIENISSNDSIGGMIKTYVLNVPKSLGGSYFNGVESVISYLVYGIPAVKSVSFGDGYSFLNAYGSTVLDETIYENDKIKYLANHNGGILGGITTGEPIIINTIIKPTPTISQNVKTINLNTKENVIHSFNGRHDPCIVPRAYVPIESVVSLAILDLILSNYGYDYFKKCE